LACKLIPTRKILGMTAQEAGSKAGCKPMVNFVSPVTRESLVVNGVIGRR